MILNSLTITNFKNIAAAHLTFSDKINCFLGKNGMGKTNILDAIYFLSFAKSSISNQNAHIVMHGQELFLLQAKYKTDNSLSSLSVNCGMKIGHKKHIKVNDKEIKKFSNYIGTIPLIMISPSDNMLITGGSDERRKFMDMLIVQYDTLYMQHIVKYDKLLKQRNYLLKSGNIDWEYMGLLEDMMSEAAAYIYKVRNKFIIEFLPIFKSIYFSLSKKKEEVVDINYISHGDQGELAPLLRKAHNKEQILGYTLYGTHKDELEFLFNGFPIKKEASQGQSKTYFIALKLGQFIFLNQKMSISIEADMIEVAPILLLDDIFDKLDSSRVDNIIDYLSKEIHCQIFITDTDKKFLNKILSKSSLSYKIFHVEQGNIIECDD